MNLLNDTLCDSIFVCGGFWGVVAAAGVRLGSVAAHSCMAVVCARAAVRLRLSPRCGGSTALAGVRH